MGSAQASSIPYTPFHNSDIDQSYYLPVQTVVTSHSLNSLAFTQFNTSLQSSSIIPIYSDRTLQSLPNVVHLLAPSALPTGPEEPTQNSALHSIRARCEVVVGTMFILMAGIVLALTVHYDVVGNSSLENILGLSTGAIIFIAGTSLLLRHVANNCSELATSAQIQELDDQETELVPSDIDLRPLLSSMDPQTSTQNWGLMPARYTQPGYIGNDLEPVYYASIP